MLQHENPRPVSAQVPRPSSAHAAREEEQQQAWEQLLQEAQDEDAYLKELAGLDDLSLARSLQVIVNTTTSTVSHLGEKLPSLHELSLNNSVLECLRDLGTGFKQLRVLWVCRCGLTSLDGASGLPALRELYAAFNDITDLQALDTCTELEVLDLEGNCVSDLDMVHLLAPLTNLQALTLAGNPISHAPGYRNLVVRSLPSLSTLDDTEVSEADRMPCPADRAEGLPGSSHAHEVQGGSERGRVQEGECTPSPQQQQQQQQQGDLERGPSIRGSEHDSAPGAHNASGSSTGLGGTTAEGDRDGQGDTQGSGTERHRGPGEASTDGHGAISTSHTEPVPLKRELDMVHQGIKRARVGMDSHEFREMEMAVLLDGQEAALGTAGIPGSPCSSRTAAPPSSGSSGTSTSQHHSQQNLHNQQQQQQQQRLSHRPSSASPLMPFSAGSWIRTLRASQASSCSTSGSLLDPLQQPRQEYVPRSAASRAGTSDAPLSRPASAHPNGGARPHSSASSRPFSARLGTALSPAAAAGADGKRLGHGSSAPPTADGGLYWRKHRLQAAQAPSSGGILDGVLTGTQLHKAASEDPDDDTEASASALTRGGGAIGGSLARDLRRRRKAAAGGVGFQKGLHSSLAVGRQGGGLGWKLGAGSGSVSVYNVEALLQELCKWKVETADRALAQEEGPTEGAWRDNEGDELEIIPDADAQELGLDGQACTTHIGRRADILDLGSGAEEGGRLGRQGSMREGGLGSEKHADQQQQGMRVQRQGEAGGDASSRLSSASSSTSSRAAAGESVSRAHSAPGSHSSSSSRQPSGRSSSGTQHRTILAKVIRDAEAISQSQQHHHHRYEPVISGPSPQHACPQQHAHHSHRHHQTGPSSSTSNHHARGTSRLDSSRPISGSSSNLSNSKPAIAGEIDISSSNPRPRRRSSSGD